MGDERLRDSGEKPPIERRQEKLDDSKRRYKEQVERTGGQITSRELDKKLNGIAERTDRENGW